jgi:hypothetical protein
MAVVRNTRRRCKERPVLDASPSHAFVQEFLERRAFGRHDGQTRVEVCDGLLVKIETSRQTVISIPGYLP